MKFEKITNSKIKIILSLQEIQSNNISVENFLSCSEASQEILDMIISKAQLEIGFKPENCELLVEALLPSDNECILIITKLSDNITYSIKNKNSFIFKFECFDDFISLCVFLKNFSNFSISKLFKNTSLIYYNNYYYLKIFIDNSYSCFDCMKSLFEEFATIIPHSENIDGILNEYGKIICSKNALIKCINYFVKNKSGSF